MEDGWLAAQGTPYGWDDARDMSRFFMPVLTSWRKRRNDLADDVFELCWFMVRLPLWKSAGPQLKFSSSSLERACESVIPQVGAASSVNAASKQPTKPRKPISMKLSSQVTIVRSKDAIHIYGPFNEANHQCYKNRNGRLDPTKELHGEKPWKFAQTAAVHSMVDSLFGSDASPLVRVIVTESDIRKHGRTWTIGGYLLAKSQGRDQGVAIPKGVQLESGQWLPSGGSMKYPEIQAEDVLLSLVVRQDFAERHQLKIVAEEAQPTAPSQSAETKGLLRYFVVLADDSCSETINFENRKAECFFLSTANVLAKSTDEAFVLASEAIQDGHHRPVAALTVGDLRALADVLEGCSLSLRQPVTSTIGGYSTRKQLDSGT